MVALLMVCIAGCLHGQVYHVKKIRPGDLNINGKADSNTWSRAGLLTHFSLPWDSGLAPATSFAALWDEAWLYCRFLVKDDSIITYVKNNEKRETGASDRVEIFFKQDDRMQPYYCLEMDAAGRIMDYSAMHYRQMNYLWQWPAAQLQVKTVRTKDGYILEAAISLASLKQLGLLKRNRLQAGLFRAECTGIENGRPNFKWISWINPSVPEPDFHIPAAFGILLLDDNKKY